MNRMHRQFILHCVIILISEHLSQYKSMYASGESQTSRLDDIRQTEYDQQLSKQNLPSVANPVNKQELQSATFKRSRSDDKQQARPDQMGGPRKSCRGTSSVEQGS